jgi:glycosyltransferase involved in cell wall biosynthesis
VSKRITVGMPVYNGADQVAAALKCLQEQTYRDFEVIISVDGNDQATADVCRPFLSDKRFRMVVHLERLDWFGNFNWLLEQPLGEFFCYRQHDDTTAPEFFDVLLRNADANPDAAAIYADCRWKGGRSDIETAPSIEGGTLDRLRQYIEKKQPVAVRGLMRRQAVQQAGPIRSDEFRGLSEIFVWLAKVLRWGSFIRVPEALYYRLDHAANYHKQWFDWPEERKRASWTTLFTGLLEATMPVCVTPEERLFFQLFILDRVAVLRSGQSYHYGATSPHESGALILECLKRLEQEGNTHLFEAQILVMRQPSGSVEADVEQLRIELRRRTIQADRLRSELRQKATEAEHISARLEAVYHSRSWRFAKPLRTLRHAWEAIAGLPRRKERPAKTDQGNSRSHFGT